MPGNLCQIGVRDIIDIGLFSLFFCVNPKTLEIFLLIGVQLTIYSVKQLPKYKDKNRDSEFTELKEYEQIVFYLQATMQVILVGLLATYLPLGYQFPSLDLLQHIVYEYMNTMDTYLYTSVLLKLSRSRRSNFNSILLNFSIYTQYSESLDKLVDQNRLVDFKKSGRIQILKYSV